MSSCYNQKQPWSINKATGKASAEGTAFSLQNWGGTTLVYQFSISNRNADMLRNIVAGTLCSLATTNSPLLQLFNQPLPVVPLELDPQAQMCKFLLFPMVCLTSLQDSLLELASCTMLECFTIPFSLFHTPLLCWNMLSPFDSLLFFFTACCSHPSGSIRVCGQFIVIPPTTIYPFHAEHGCSYSDSRNATSCSFCSCPGRCCIPLFHAGLGHPYSVHNTRLQSFHAIHRQAKTLTLV